MALGHRTGEDEFRGAQHDVAVRVTGAMWILGPLTMAPFTALYPPTAQLGGLGWVVFGVLGAASIAFGLLAVSMRIRPSWNQLYMSSFNGVVQIAAMQWLAGGGEAPYLAWLLLPMVGAATQRTPPVCVPVVLAATTAALSPLLYSPVDLPPAMAQLVVGVAMTMVVSSVMTSVRHHRARLRDAGERAATLARLDLLTGLPNRRAFEETLAMAVDDHHRRGQALSLILCDVDSFKEVNDTFGHPAGDKCLRSIAATLRTELRRPEAAFRWAGDEFSVILHNTDAPSATAVAARLADAVQARCRRPDGRPITVGVGIATLHDGMTAPQFLAEADVALLESKTARRRVDAGADVASDPRRPAAL